MSAHRRSAPARTPHLARTPERGQASVELIAVVPAVLLVAALLWSLLAAAEAGVLTAAAARAGARAAAVGDNARVAARSALPASLRRGLEVRGGSGRPVTVAVRVPLIGRRWGPRLRWEARAHLPGAG